MNTDRMKIYLNIAENISKFSRCLKGNFGVVIVKNDYILGTGYNGPARGVEHCNPCRREGFPRGQGYEKCVAIHAETNAIINSGGRERCLDSTLYINSHNRKFDETKYHESMGNFPCDNCARNIIQAGILWVIQAGYNGEPIIHNIPDLVKKGKIW